MKKLILSIGSVKFEIDGKGLDVDTLLEHSAYAEFISSSKNYKIRLPLTVHYKNPSGPKLSRIVFDSKSLWSLSLGPDGYSMRIGPPAPAAPYRIVKFKKKLKSVDIYVLAGRNNTAFHNPFVYPLDQIMTLMLLSSNEGALTHCCSISDKNEKCFLFMGSSGAGKSTMAGLFKDSGNYLILNDDRNILKKEGRRFFLYSTPWHGDFKEYHAARKPMHRIYFIKHSLSNSCRRMTVPEALVNLLKCSFIPFWDKNLADSSLEFLRKVSENVPTYELGFYPDRRIVDFIEEYAD